LPAVVKGSSSRAPAGKIVDFLISHPEDTFPRIDAIKIKTKDGMRIVPIAEVAVDRDGPVLLNAFPTIESPSDDDALYLVEDLLDKQIVDVDGRKVVRINDLELAMTAARCGSSRRRSAWRDCCGGWASARGPRPGRPGTAQPHRLEQRRADP